MEELRREKDANSAAISIPLGLLFGDRIVTTAYVSTLVHFMSVEPCLKTFIELTCALEI